MAYQKVEPIIIDDPYRSDEIEIDLLLEAIYRKYGYDFRKYSRASLKRRIYNQIESCGLENISELQYNILYDKAMFVELLENLTINVTEMFRDPDFYLAFRKQVIPQLKTYPSIKIWHAGCSTGEEIYSMCILLREEGLLDRAQIYATDIDKNVLAKAKKGIFPIRAFKQYSDNYIKAGGTGSLSDYYTARYEGAIIDQSLKRNIVFADHDLVTDQVFGEIQVILCRNVMIYFDRSLQDRVVRLFYDSLDLGGTLCLGSKESLRFIECGKKFLPVNEKQKIYKKSEVSKTL